MSEQTQQTIPMTEERWYELDKHYSPAKSVDHASAAVVECLSEIARLENELTALEERRQYGADIINDMKLEAELADAHAKEVEQQLVELMRIVSQMRQMATGSVPQCLNLATIDRLLAGIPIK